jgi:YebC/PmpR family DNA-binding regulatory protein
MSGHSKWATIHRQKEVKDAARGKVFSKYAKLITIAAKTGGSNPDTNFRLRDIIEKAKEVNMPKENVDRALEKATSESQNLEEVMYEGFGPSGVPVLIQATTDNRNRTGQEIKNLLEKNGGSLAGPGAVSFQFDHMGFILVEKQGDGTEETLKLIDIGVEDFEEGESSIACFVQPHDLYAKKKDIENAGFKVITSELIMKPKISQEIEDQAKMDKILAFIDTLEAHDDVHKVFTTV